MTKPASDNTVDLYVYRRFKLRCTLEQAAHAFYNQPSYRDTLPEQQYRYYEWVIWQFLNLKLPPLT